jgi:stalled ribosome alternative rescue factor ArfA
MAHRKKRKPTKPRNAILALVAKNDPARFRDRVLHPEKGKGRKERPRDNKADDFFDCAA